VARYRIESGCRFSVDSGFKEDIVVIDTLRASSTIVTALAAGVKEIYPVCSDAEALRLKENGIPVAGEKGGVRLKGYDFGNSPVELLEAFNKKPFEQLGLTTTNMIPLLTKLRSAYICSSLNLAYMSDYISGRNACLIAVGGINGNAEDLGVALALVASIAGADYNEDMIACFIRESNAAQHLRSIGYVDDVDFISRANVYDVIAWYDGSVIHDAGRSCG